MTCDYCTRAAQEVSGLFHTACRGCQARRLSRTPLFAQPIAARRADKAYRRALGASGLLDADVVAAAAADFEQRETAHG